MSHDGTQTPYPHIHQHPHQPLPTDTHTPHPTPHPSTLTQLVLAGVVRQLYNRKGEAPHGPSFQRVNACNVRAPALHLLQL